MEYNRKFSKSAPAIAVTIRNDKSKRRLTRLFSMSRLFSKTSKRKRSSRSEINNKEDENMSTHTPSDENSSYKSMFILPQTTPHLTIYNIDKAECLLFNKNRGFLPEEVDWSVICRVRPHWKGEDDIWALGSDGTEYVCSRDLIGQNPVFHLLKSFMRREMLTKHITTEYDVYYFDNLISKGRFERDTFKWYLTQDPQTGSIVDVL